MFSERLCEHTRQGPLRGPQTFFLLHTSLVFFNLSPPSHPSNKHTHTHTHLSRVECIRMIKSLAHGNLIIIFFLFSGWRQLWVVIQDSRRKSKIRHFFLLWRKRLHVEWWNPSQDRKEIQVRFSSLRNIKRRGERWGGKNRTGQESREQGRRAENRAGEGEKGEDGKAGKVEEYGSPWIRFQMHQLWRHIQFFILYHHDRLKLFSKNISSITGL